MVPPGPGFEAIARSQVPRLLSEALGLSSKQVRLHQAREGRRYDFEVIAGDRLLLIEVLGRADRAPLLSHWGRIKRAGAKLGAIPVIVVPFMTDLARALADEHRINWLDLSGNASIRAPGFIVRVSGNSDRYARRGRPSSVFERRSSRLARMLLQAPGINWSVRECARSTGLNEGHVSRIVAQLTEDQLLVRDERRRFRVRDPSLLLDTWRDAADFSSHRVLRGHVPARSGEELLKSLAESFPMRTLGYAATGLGAAWLYDHFAMFRLVTFYLREWPTPEQLAYVSFREDPGGANVWLVLPNDDGVFSGQRVVDGIRCVHPVQVYVDLKDQPERASEASEHLKSNSLLLGSS